MEKSRINFPNLFTKQTEKHNHNRETELEIAWQLNDNTIVFKRPFVEGTIGMSAE